MGLHKNLRTRVSEPGAVATGLRLNLKSHPLIVITRFQRLSQSELCQSWDVAPGCYISRLWRCRLGWDSVREFLIQLTGTRAETYAPRIRVSTRSARSSFSALITSASFGAPRRSR